MREVVHMELPPLTRYIQTLVHKRGTPELAHVFHHTPKLKQAFRNYCILGINRVIGTCKAHNETEAIQAYANLLSHNFSHLVLEFLQQVRKVRASVCECEALEGECAICLEGGCNVKMKCCEGVMHRGCNEEYQMMGFTACPYCKQAF
jgi:hypothetical protein